MHCHWRSWSSTEGQDQSKRCSCCTSSCPAASWLSISTNIIDVCSVQHSLQVFSDLIVPASCSWPLGCWRSILYSSYRQKSRFGTASPPYLARDPFVLDLPRSMVLLYSIRSLRFSTLFLREEFERSQRDMRFGPSLTLRPDWVSPPD